MRIRDELDLGVNQMVATSTKSSNQSYLITTQRPAREFFEDAQPADQGSGQVVNLGSPSSLDDVRILLDEFVMCGEKRRIAHDWRTGDLPTESVCRRCGLGVDAVYGSALVFSEESCRIPWIEWRAGVRNLTDIELLHAMTDADVASLTHGREGWIGSTRPIYAVLGELSVLRREIARRELDWQNWEGGWECFLDTVRRRSGRAGL